MKNGFRNVLKQVQENPDDLDAHFELAKTYESSDKVDEAIAQYQQISELQPDNPQWYKKLGDLYQKQRGTGEVVEGPALALLEQAAAAYEQAIQLEPDAYELYRLLARIHTKSERLSDAEAVYRRALEASLTQSEHDAAVKAILQLYTDNEQEDKHIAFLEELKPKMENSVTLYELLGDAYSKAGDTKNAEIAYNQWLKLRQREVNRQQSYSRYSDFAVELLDKGLYPETALKFARRAAQRGTSSSYILTLGRANLVNGQYPEALKQFKQGLETLTSGPTQRNFFSWVSQFGKKTDDKESYIGMLNELVSAVPDNQIVQFDLNLVLAEFCRENDMPEKAKAHIQRTGFITEDMWWTLGPFDNTGGIGYNTAYIREDATLIDPTTKYDGVEGKVSWQKSTDRTLDGYIGLGKDVDWGVAYAFATVISPDERKIQFRFDSDDQGKIWLNGKEVHAHTRTYSAQIDRDIIPVTFKPGKNSILVKVCEEEEGWGFYLRITGEDGKPFDDLKIGASE